MTIAKRLSALIFGLLAALLLPLGVFAAGSIEADREVSLKISYQSENTPLVGAQFDIYLVATVDEYGELTVTEDFSAFNVNIRGENDEAWRTLASTLEGYVLLHAIPAADSGKTDGDGMVSFPASAGERLEQGLYLVLGRRHTQNGYRYDAAPFMVLLPGLDRENNVWLYEVTANPKYTVFEIPEIPGDDTVDRKVVKVWKDDGQETKRPTEVVVQLLRDGTVYDTVTLNADNHWRYTWRNLDNSFRWSLVENEVEDYTVEITREGITFVVTNTRDDDTPDEPDEPEKPVPPDEPEKPDEPKEPEEPTKPEEPEEPVPPEEPTKPEEPAKPDEPEEPDKPRLPQTGQLWWPVPVLLAAGMLFIIIGLVRRREIDDEQWSNETE